MPDKYLQKLQRVQNACARLIMCGRKYDHVTPLLRELHWLPIKERIKFKLLVLTYRSLCGEAPKYLSDLLQPYIPTRSLRSQDSLLLVVPKTRLHLYGDRAFARAVPVLWNTLPRNIKAAKDTFRNLLKSHMFRSVYCS